MYQMFVYCASKMQIINSFMRTYIDYLFYNYISCNKVPLLSIFLAISGSSLGADPSGFLFIFTPFLSNCFSMILAFMAYESAISFYKDKKTSNFVN